MALFRWSLPLILLGSLPGLRAADAPDGTAFEHRLLGVDAHNLIRIRYCGLAAQVQLANLKFRGAEWEKQSLEYLKRNLRAGGMVKIELEKEWDGPGPPPAHVFCGDKYLNAELVRQGFALTDASSPKHGAALQQAMLEATRRKAGLWSDEAMAAEKKPPPPATIAEPPRTQPAPVPPPPPPPPPERDVAPPGYQGMVVADMSSDEYHYPQSRFAKTIRAAARVEYRSPEEAERAKPKPKRPNPASFPDRYQSWLAKNQPVKVPAGSLEKQMAEARKTYDEALVILREGYQDRSRLNQNLKRAEQLLDAQMRCLEPLAEARPNDAALQRLAEEMNMQLYQCRKAQSIR